MTFTHKNLLLLCLALVLAMKLSMAPTLARPLDHSNATLSYRQRHELWMARHGRVYKDELEKEKRFNIFKKNVKRIEKFNDNAPSSHKLFKLGINAFADLTTEEVVATRTGFVARRSNNQPVSDVTITNNDLISQNLTDSSSSLDWREKGAVTSIKNQGECGCCWAFSAAAAVEGLNQIKTGQLISLSAQELLDCVQANKGCDGGEMRNAFAFIQQNNNGLVTEDVYPYQGSQSQCQAGTLTGNVVTIDGYQSLPQNDEATLMEAVSQQPVSIGIDGSGFQFQHYQSGVFNGECGQEMTHAVTLIGYDTDTDGTNYWLVKNSWGESWGENGYMRIIRDMNQCGLTLDASYPM